MKMAGPSRLLSRVTLRSSSRENCESLILNTQIQEEADKFGRAAGYMSACAYGGAGEEGFHENMID